MDDTKTPTVEQYDKAIAGVESFLANSVIFIGGLMSDLPTAGMLTRLKQERAKLIAASS